MRRTVYLIKKDPEKAPGGDNWIVTDQKGFARFLRTPQGMKRKKEFGRIGPCGKDDPVIIAECGQARAKEWLREKNRSAYLRKTGGDEKARCVFYGLTEDPGGPAGQKLAEIPDEDADVPRTAELKVMTEKLRAALETIPARDRDLIEKLYLSPSPLSEARYAALAGSTREAVHERKRSVLRRLRKILGNPEPESKGS